MARRTTCSEPARIRLASPTSVSSQGRGGQIHEAHPDQQTAHLRLLGQAGGSVPVAPRLVVEAGQVVMAEIPLLFATPQDALQHPHVDLAILLRKGFRTLALPTHEQVDRFFASLERVFTEEWARQQTQHQPSGNQGP